jgi:hypothetical protein
MFATTPRQREYVNALEVAGSNAQAAELLGIDRRAVDRAIADMRDRAYAAGYRVLAKEPSILFLDIETAPIVARVWGLWGRDNNVVGGHRYVLDDSRIICFAYKWKGGSPHFIKEGDYPSRREFLGYLWYLLDRADWVVTHNGNKFDIKRINAELLEQEFSPYSPIKSIDTYNLSRQRFKFSSHRLDALGTKLLGESKVDTGGFGLWVECLEGNEEAWTKMEEYNIQDIELLEKLYYRLAAWANNHPNYALYSESDDPICVTCGSDRIEEMDKTNKTNVLEYAQYRCVDCGTVMRERRAKPREVTQVMTRAR